MSYIQSNTNSGTGVAGSVTLNGVIAGNLLVVTVGTSGAGTTVSVSGGGATWTRRSGRAFQTGAGGTEIWEGVGTTGGNITIIPDFAAASVTWGTCIAEYSNMEAAPFDKTAQATAASGTAISSGNTVATTTPAQLLIGTGSAASAITDDAGWNRRETSGAPFTCNLSDKTVSAKAAYAYTGTIGVSGAWTACIATFKVRGFGQLLSNTRNRRVM